MQLIKIRHRFDGTAIEMIGQLWAYDEIHIINFCFLEPGRTTWGWLVRNEAHEWIVISFNFCKKKISSNKMIHSSWRFYIQLESVNRGWSDKSFCCWIFFTGQDCFLHCHHWAIVPTPQLLLIWYFENKSKTKKLNCCNAYFFQDHIAYLIGEQFHLLLDCFYFTFNPFDSFFNNVGTLMEIV